MDIFTSGAEKIAALKDDLRRARRSICIQYYIFCDDRVGREVRDILIGRARAGVDVRLIYDHVGCWGTPYGIGYCWTGGATGLGLHLP